MDTRKQITTWVDTNREDLIETANEIFKHPEISLEEKVSSKILADYLEKQIIGDLPDLTILGIW